MHATGIDFELLPEPRRPAITYEGRKYKGTWRIFKRIHIDGQEPTFRVLNLDVSPPTWGPKAKPQGASCVAWEILTEVTTVGIANALTPNLVQTLLLRLPEEKEWRITDIGLVQWVGLFLTGGPCCGKEPQNWNEMPEEPQDPSSTP